MIKLQNVFVTLVNMTLNDDTKIKFIYCGLLE